MTTLTFLKCSFPNCNNTVGQHSKLKNTNKQVCSAHRTHKKREVDKWKMNQGCANNDGHYGFPCICSEILDPITLLIAIDGDPFKAAFKLTRSSGSEVAKDTTVSPTTILEILSLKDRATEARTKNSPPITKRPNPNSIKIISIRLFFYEDKS